MMPGYKIPTVPSQWPRQSLRLSRTRKPYLTLQTRDRRGRRAPSGSYLCILDSLFFIIYYSSFIIYHLLSIICYLFIIYLLFIYIGSADSRQTWQTRAERAILRRKRCVHAHHGLRRHSECKTPHLYDAQTFVLDP